MNMNISLEFWHLVSFVGMLVGGYFTTGKLLLAQVEKRLDERFSNIDRRLAAFEDAAKEHDRERLRLERDLLLLRSEMAEKYVRRAECSNCGAHRDPS